MVNGWETWAAAHPLPALAGLLAATLVFSTMIMRTLAGFVGPSRLGLAVCFVPGVVVHELAHAAACWLIGTRVRRIVLWNGSGGCVEHDRPRWAVLQPLISFFPVPVGLAVVAIAGRHFAEGDRLRNGLLLWLMVSVGATLAPSREDWRSALLGLVALLAVLLGVGRFYPGAWSGLDPWARSLTVHVAPVVLILAAILIVLKVVSVAMRTRR